MKSFMRELAEQRSDHREVLHSRIQQSLQLFSSLCFICMYVLLFTKPVAAVLLGFLVAMTTRQIGYAFFEPSAPEREPEGVPARRAGFDAKHKLFLHAVWGVATLLLVADPTLCGLFDAPHDFQEFVDHLAKVWLAVGVGALLLRGVQLTVSRSLRTSLVWLTKIATDPFCDVKLYSKAPMLLLRGELCDEEAKQRLDGRTA